MEKKQETDRLRRDGDAAESRKRSDTDRDRTDRRDLSDRTRQNARGTRQSREGLDRERAADDANLGVERDRTDSHRASERGVADDALAREKEAREDSDEALESRIDRDARRDAVLREILTLVETQMGVVEGSLKELLATVPHDGRLNGEVEKIRVAGVRMRRLVADVLDPGDGRRRYHDVGGSG